MVSRVVSFVRRWVPNFENDLRINSSLFTKKASMWISPTGKHTLFAITRWWDSIRNVDVSLRLGVGIILMTESMRNHFGNIKKNAKHWYMIDWFRITSSKWKSKHTSIMGFFVFCFHVKIQSIYCLIPPELNAKCISSSVCICTI